MVIIAALLVLVLGIHSATASRDPAAKKIVESKKNTTEGPDPLLITLNQYYGKQIAIFLFSSILFHSFFKMTSYGRFKGQQIKMTRKDLIFVRFPPPNQCREMVWNREIRTW